MTIIKKTAEAVDNHQNNGRKFPAESYEYDDDVTPEAVEKMRDLARDHMSDGKWEVIDGFGRTSR